MSFKSTKQFVNFLFENIGRTEKLILNESQGKVVYVLRDDGYMGTPLGVYTTKEQAEQAKQGDESVQEETVQARKIEDFNSDDLPEHKKEEYLEHLKNPQIPYYVFLSDDGILVFDNIGQAYKHGLDNYGPDWSVYPMKENEHTNPNALQEGFLFKRNRRHREFF